MNARLAATMLCWHVALLGADVNSEVPVLNPEAEAIAAALKKALPSQGWTVENKISMVAIRGPTVPMLWPVSLPGTNDDDENWRQYAAPNKVEILIHFQRRIDDSDLSHLRQLRLNFSEIQHKISDPTSKHRMDEIKHFGTIRLPDYRSQFSSVFIENSTLGYRIRSTEVVRALEAMEAMFHALWEPIPE